MQYRKNICKSIDKVGTRERQSCPLISCSHFERRKWKNGKKGKKGKKETKKKGKKETPKKRKTGQLLSFSYE